jgi:hypothetical protein
MKSPLLSVKTTKPVASKGGVPAHFVVNQYRTRSQTCKAEDELTSTETTHQ